MEWSKIDVRIASKYNEYKRIEKESAGAAAHGERLLSVAIIFAGKVEALEVAGFRKRSVYGRVAYGEIRLADLEAIAALPQVDRIEEGSSPRALDVSVPEIHAPQVWSGAPSYKGSGVAVGIVDSGIDIFHNCFRNPDGGNTRILFLWDQTIPSAGAAPPGFTYGREFTAAQINAALGTPDQRFPSEDLGGHGTHVAGTAAGDGSQAGNCHLGDHYIGVAPEADLIVVKRDMAGRSGAYVDGVHYVFQRAGTKAAVVNLSLGTGAASHDGTGTDEIAIDALLSPGTGGRAVVVAMGNSADSGHHAHRTVTANGSATMTFQVLPGDRFRVFASIWYGSTGPIGGPVGPGGAARLDLTLRAPDGTTASVSPGTDPAAQPLGGSTVDFWSFPNAGRMGRHLIQIILSPTSQGLLTAGEWRITLAETAGAATEVDCWLTPDSQFHAHEPVAARGTVAIRFNVRNKVGGTDVGTISYTGGGRISFTLTTPDPDTTAVVAAGAGSVTRDAGRHTVNVVSTVDATPAAQHKIEFWIVAPVGKEVETGQWTITLTETAGTATTAEAVLPEERPWAQVTGASGPRVERNWPTFVDADRDPSRTIESPASAQNVIAVGAYDPGNGELAAFSSRGPTVDGRHKPDLSAPGVAITAPKTRARGTPLVSDCCVTFYKDDQGTSMAAPHVTGVVALMFQRNATLDFVAIRNALVAQVRPRPAGASVDDWGAGKLDAQQTLANIVAAGGGGGGGGGGGHIIYEPSLAPEDLGVRVPIAAVWPRYAATPSRMSELHRDLSVTPAGNLLMALLSRHFDELSRIVNGVRRVGALWRRMEGPLLVRTVIGWRGGPSPPVPPILGGRPVAHGLARLMRVLERYASPVLLTDIRTHRYFLLALPGASLAEVAIQGDAEHAGPAGHARDRRA